MTLMTPMTLMNLVVPVERLQLRANRDYMDVHVRHRLARLPPVLNGEVAAGDTVSALDGCLHRTRGLPQVLSWVRGCVTVGGGRWAVVFFAVITRSRNAM